ncbi:hypothetical protein Dthio_PD3502 [Desulfonatronospira thiodismutans ASO3-1]|uniref:PD-(D/E)XK nuclease superfamily protein n=1 Tax=Desulfonatronospira thiodismutans ASO3-1 TaxID=555779 RepID=D6SMZ7_9BACT|nr:PD-(D/E)XK nuclease family protein [Desulfonatronospira thiodismutans]EFI36058.1 hypothetical protein Dthio_PD3502 [Desulfonatronospira thiodismutans ASO3-1]
MNIFKVIASGHGSFQETNASAILAWLLHPEMEHGLGYTFLSRFFNEIKSYDNNEIKSSDNSELNDLAEKLNHKFRGELENKNNLWLDLEFDVNTSVIDIIIVFENWVFAIENKIYSSSFSKGQLEKEYKGLKTQEKFKNKKIVLIYLVPVGEDSETNEENFAKEFDGLSVDGQDFKRLITWQKNQIVNVGSISEVIHTVLRDEFSGTIDPIPEYTRHTLKALLSFISNDFNGYAYEEKQSHSGLNPLTEYKLEYDKLKQMSSGFVGVGNGIRGLLRMDGNDIKSYKYQYTSHNMENKKNWMPIDVFKKLASWKLGASTPDIKWQGKFPADILYKISKDYRSTVFIGIQGGENALNSMSSSDIKNKEWQVGTEKVSSHWIPGDKFKEILDEKHVF